MSLNKKLNGGEIIKKKIVLKLEKQWKWFYGKRNLLKRNDFFPRFIYKEFYNFPYVQINIKSQVSRWRINHKQIILTNDTYMHLSL